jgi:hypothetical protein
MGFDALITMSPSRVNGKDYYWINSIFTHTPAKLSENLWILDLIKNEKPFFSKFNNVEMSLNIKNSLIIINNTYIEYNIINLFTQIKVYSKKIKFLDGTIYVYDDNYYFLTNNCFSKYKNKKKLLYKLKELVTEIKPSCIIDLSIIYSNYLKNKSVIQLKSAIIDNDYKNYKYNVLFPNYTEAILPYKKTKYLIEDTISIKNYDQKNVVEKLLKIDTTENIKNSKILFGSESIYITMLLSNNFNISCFPLSVVINYIDVSKENETRNMQKVYSKISKNIINSLFSIF